MRFGQEAAFENRLAQTLAKQAAAFHRQQRTESLKAGAVSINPRRQRHFEAAQAKIGGGDHQHRQRNAGAQNQQKPAPRQVGDKQQRHHNRKHHQRRSQVAGSVNQADADTGGQRHPADALEVVEHVELALQKARHIHNRYQLKQLAGLDFDKTQRQPAAGAVYRFTQKGDEAHQQQQQHQNVFGRTLPNPHRHLRDQPDAQHQPEQHELGLLKKIHGALVEIVGIKLRCGRGEHHHQPQPQQAEQHPQQGLVVNVAVFLQVAVKQVGLVGAVVEKAGNRIHKGPIRGGRNAFRLP